MSYEICEAALLNSWGVSYWVGAACGFGVGVMAVLASWSLMDNDK